MADFREEKQAVHSNRKPDIRLIESVLMFAIRVSDKNNAVAAGTCFHVEKNAQVRGSFLTKGPERLFFAEAIKIYCDELVNVFVGL